MLIVGPRSFTGKVNVRRLAWHILYPSITLHALSEAGTREMAASAAAAYSHRGESALQQAMYLYAAVVA